jgi:acyl-CoA thioester hydrolase
MSGYMQLPLQRAARGVAEGCAAAGWPPERWGSRGRRRRGRPHGGATLASVTAPFRHRTRVRWAECDLQGVAFYPNYLAWFDLVLTELWRAGGLPYPEMIRGGADMVVAEAAIRYHASARFDEEIDLLATVRRLGSTSITTSISIERAEDGRLLAEGELRHVCVDAQTMEKRELPRHLRDVLSRFTVESERIAR